MQPSSLLNADALPTLIEDDEEDNTVTARGLQQRQRLVNIFA